MTVTLVSQDSPTDGTSGPFVDIVAVHGLDEDSTTAWTHPETGCSWIRDLLPLEIPRSRVFTFDYKADATSFFGSSSADRILHHARTLLQELSAERELNGGTTRPIVFVCHGLGGIIVKKALAISSSSTSAKLTHLHSIVTCTFGIIFLGTPHEGIDKCKWYLLSRGLKGILRHQSQLVAAIEKNSETLQNITEQFAPLLKQFYIHNFWETVETTRGISRGYIVSSASAAPPAWKDTERSGLPATHAQMCKFRDRNESGYRTIRSSLQRYAAKAAPVIAARLEEANKYLRARREYEATEILTFNMYDENKPFHVQWQSVKDIRNQHYIVPFAVSHTYTGRERLARGLQEKILAPNDRQKRFVLYGVGGSGKTQFCLKFAWDNRDSFWGVFWVDASSPKRAEQAFSKLACIGRMEEKFESGMYWLSRQDMPWLLVIDNADDTEFDYAQYFPPGVKGHILVTSRNPDCKVHATIGFEEFNWLEEEDAITLLLRTACVQGIHDDDTRESARPIVKALGCLPLALIQAGASIRQNICSLEDYLDVFYSYKTRLFSTALQQGTGWYKHTIFTTFELSLNKIKSLGTNEAIDAIEILHVLAFLHFDQVPQAIFEKAFAGLQSDNMSETNESFVDKIMKLLGDLATISNGYGGWLTPLAEGRLPRIFTPAGERWDKLRFRNAIAILRSYSLIFSNRAVDSYSMHPMVHFWARERLRPSAQRLWGNVASRIIAAAITTGTKESDVAYRRQLIPHVDFCLRNGASDSHPKLQLNTANIGQFTRFAATYAEGGRWDDAACIQEQVLRIRTGSPGQHSFEVLDVMTDLSRSYWNASQLANALKIQALILDSLNQKLGPHDPKTLQAMDNLGRTYWLCGKIPEADEMGRKSFEGLTKVAGPDHPFTLSAMHGFARARMHLGHFEEAQRLQIKAWEGMLRLYDDTNLTTLETMQDLGMSCLALGEIDEAERLVSHVLDARKRILGPEHAHTLWSINDLSKVYCAQGYPKDAVALLIPTREISTRTLGPLHIGTFMTLFNLAHAYRAMGKLEEAESIISELISAEIKALGPTHQDVYSAKLELAQVYKEGGDMDQAETLSEEVFRARREKLGQRNGRTLQASRLLDEIRQVSERTDNEVLLEKSSTVETAVPKKP